LLDLIDQGVCDLSGLEALVLDEADQMLDMGFAKPIERIVSTLPKDRHTLLFSATMPKSIAALAESLLRDPAKVEIAPPSTTVERIEQSVMFLDAADKKAALLAMLRTPEIGQAVVFTLQKNIANEVCAFISDGGITAEALHGNKSQGQRERALDAFRAGTVQVLDGYRRARHRCRYGDACFQSRPAEPAGKLCPPDRPHRSRRAQRLRHHALRCRAACLAA
jgi:ATP-dependent RNA helicase RhlE